MIEAPGIIVNGAKITPEQINAEVQYHPADNLFDAKYEAMQALVIKELLLQRAIGLGLCTDGDTEDIDGIFETLFEKEIDVPEADEKTCQRFYNANKDKFFTSPLFEAAHILYLAPAKDKKMCSVALKKAQEALLRICKNSEKFEDIAKKESACSSANVGGHLGQVAKGQTTPDFEQALLSMQEGDISTTPLKSEFGYHIIKVYKRFEGEQLPFEAVKDRIANDLARQSWQRAFSQYIQLLAGKADISGFQLKQSNTPLVQ